MKRVIGLFALLCGLFGSVYAQDAVKTKAVGLVFSNLDNFGVRYYFGNQKTVFRITALSLGVSDTHTDVFPGTVKTTNSGLGLAFGVEFPKPINDKLDFIYGIQLSGDYRNSNSEFDGVETKSDYYGLGLGFIAGVNYNVNSNFAVGLELLPSLTYNYGKAGDNVTKNLAFALSNNSAAITVRYRF